MTELDDIDRRFEGFEELLREDADLQAELARSAPEFFRASWDERRRARDDLARRRHLEWFLLERIAPGAESLAIETLAERWPERSGLDDPAALHSLLGSHAGVFEVTGVDRGQGVWMRDLASQGEYPVVEPQASALLERGDLIAGRIFPVGDGLHRVSRAAAIFRNPKLVEALRADLERAREGRRGVLRVSQGEIERMFHGADFATVTRDAVGNARALLLAGGIEAEQVDAWLEELATTPFDAEDPLPGTHEVVSGILDELAFETAIDLEAARRTLIQAWSELSAKGVGQGPSMRPQGPPKHATAPADVAEVVARFEAKRKSGVPIDEILRDLEDELALADEPEEEADEDSQAPDFPGVVGAMIEEFLWETSIESGPERQKELEPLRSFGRFARDVGVFENLSTHDLLAYTCFWLPEGGDLENGDAARALLAALQSFCRWAEEKHEVALHTQFKETLGALSSSLPRTIEANRRRTRATDRSQGDLYEVLDVDAEQGRLRVGARDGTARDATVDPHLAAWLRPGDRLRAHVHDDERIAVYCCYPPEARELEAR